MGRLLRWLGLWVAIAGCGEVEQSHRVPAAAAADDSTTTPSGDRLELHPPKRIATH
jgi:hypothetical protein